MQIGAAKGVEQEARVTHEYAGMRLMQSDRLQGLIIAAAEGAMPLGSCEGTTEKMSGHLDSIGLKWSTKPRESVIDAVKALATEQLDQTAAETVTVLEAEAATANLGELRALVVATQSVSAELTRQAMA
ncbi:hypothetical protein [Agromyces albus]|uniref:hypothetical protein n=1 Tax=Agromyces albus TaxID=205332 RepID=UPI002781CF8E|nr:hypothetical protein [Agromyces albus]MDQ0574563.1 hypothetical protein [Agromyces albus]